MDAVKYWSESNGAAESAIPTGGRDGKPSLDDHLSQLLAAGCISVGTARRPAIDPEALHPAGPARP
ncbi:MAG: hypothetical protein C4547_16395 [Phycisphaerales bacterium]|nr:MAG: hypothetical protein C4547_16395 [Phycisphaerales bacterium]